MGSQKFCEKTIFRLFAQGKGPEEAANILNERAEREEKAPVTMKQVENKFELYAAMPIGKKLNLTGMTAHVTDRLHRLMDDVADMEFVELRLADAERKQIIELLDIKRKIKDRMAKDTAPNSDSPITDDEDTDIELAKYCKKIVGCPLPESILQQRPDQIGSIS